MSIEIIGVEIGAQHQLGKPVEWRVSYSMNGAGRYIHLVSGPAIMSSIDALAAAKRQLAVR